MKAVGLITEYNPFHNGHLYHLHEALRVTGADVSIAVMSGDFVQRGEPAIIDKYARCQAAIDCGVNLVVELPVYYALSSAEGFADGAVRTLAALSADALVFGSEAGTLKPLKQIAEVLISEPEAYRSSLKKSLADGTSFPAARQKALAALLGEETSLLLTQPNNTLGIEYLKALQKHRLTVRPHTICRQGTGYNSSVLTGTLPGASALRQLLYKPHSADSFQNRTGNDVADWMPHEMLIHFYRQQNKSCPVPADDVSPFLNYRLSQIFYECNAEKDLICRQLCSCPDISADLAGRILQSFHGTQTFTELADTVKSKQYTRSRINRCLMHIVLGITNIQKNKFEGGTVPYIRILGFDTTGQNYLNHIKKKCPVPLITKTADYKELLREDIHAASLYNQIILNKYGTILPNEFRRGIYIRK